MIRHMSYRKITIILLLLPLLASIPLILILSEKPVTIFPATDSQNCYTFADSASEIVDFLVTDKQIYFKYKLRKGSAFPDAGISFDLLDKNFQCLDLSVYQECRITIYTSEPGNYRFAFKSYMQGLSNLYEYTNLRPLEKSLYLQKKTLTYKIPIHTFQTANWWIDEQKFTKKLIGKEDYHNLVLFDFQNKRDPLNQSQEEGVSVIITNISFHKSYSAFFLLTGAGIILYYLVLLLVLLRKKPQTQPQIQPELQPSPEPQPQTQALTQMQTVKTIKSTLPVKKEKISSSPDDDLKRIRILTGQLYVQPDCSLELIAQKTDLTTQRIDFVLNKAFGFTFKQFLNTMRMTEAKRLIVETDINITEIALSVGYRNVSGFSKTFKEEEGLTPGEYRKKNKIPLRKK